MPYPNTTQKNSLDVAANGRASSDPFVDVYAERDPTPSDVNYPVQKKWLNTATEAYWLLQGFSSIGGFVSAIWINFGAGGGNTIRKVGVDTFTPPGTNPVFPDVTGLITVSGGQIAAGSTVNSIRTESLLPNHYNVEVQRSQAVASSTVGDNGVSHFDSADFTVDSNGFVQLDQSNHLKIGVDAHTAPGTDPVVPDNTGLVTITGGQVAAGTTANVIRTDSLAANTFTIEVQRSQAVASSTVGDNGVSHFDSGVFSVDPNAFVSLSTSFYTEGTFTPVLSFGGASVGITYSRQSGRYIKTGNTVFVQMAITLTSKGSSTGTALVSGLPFTVINDPIYAGDGSLGSSLITLDAGYTYTYFQFVFNTNGINLIEGGSNVGLSQLSDTNFANNSDFAMWGFYFTS